MEKEFNGRVWKMGDDIDTDTIIPSKRGTIPSIKEMSKYAFELLQPKFAKKSKEGDIIVAGKNFGCGSSREQAASVISENGIKCIVAKDFARIFYRNAFNTGIILIENDKIQDHCQEGDVITVKINDYIEINGEKYTIEHKIPDNLLKIVEVGGLLNSVKNKNRRHQEEK